MDTDQYNSVFNYILIHDIHQLREQTYKIEVLRYISFLYYVVQLQVNLFEV